MGRCYPMDSDNSAVHIARKGQTMRRIDADTLIESIKRQCGFCKLMPDEEIRQLAVIMEKGLIEEVNNAPTVDSRRGKWIYQFRDSENEEYKCSECDYPTAVKHNYCPNCGADMRGKDNE